jgi:hypothetical protein
MISCAYGMFCCMMKEFTVGMITSLLPFTTSVGCLNVLCAAASQNRFDFLFRVADAHIARTFIHA